MTASHRHYLSTRSPSLVLGGILVTAVSLYLLLPVIALFFRTTPEFFFSSLQDPVVVQALLISLTTSAATVLIVIVIGTPAVYFRTRSRYPGKSLVNTIIDLPLVLPPAVAGVALLLLYGRSGLIGGAFNLVGIEIAFTTLAVVMAQVFVSSPFYLRQAKVLFEQLDPAYEATARTLGASPFRIFFTITLPLTAGGLISGAVMTFSRALGEFGATIMFAGNLPGITQTMPLAVYAAMGGDFNIAITISIILVIISFVIIGITHILSARRKTDA